MNSTPKFKVGQAVFLKDDIDYYIACYNGNYDTYSNSRPRSITIVGILIEECSGGFQIHYKFALTTNWINEIALVSELPELIKGK